ncbi:MAG: PTS fructose transporter subunit IIA [Elusimicrobiaceae bacterium]|nr:PTS fructose transporter subunit IIA [Elusimicrobiaceae bacterium]MBT3955162.1 PTS fructose transporter subunit IIA [Elusimicrobiaceae bacterium]MBT4008685.1 PTS fructose transporter subunit IIA [Elusimicrobiaceae bacterium]MBT4402483.1 PTS fructose transporter subunit IIA [Elusimicrobiaceae bacterium]MBT4440153.1 PTS fructose transporter subunit IIA [Elusimicrobiaceae bacterium]
MKTILIITHGTLGESLIETASQILGADGVHNIRSYSVSGKISIEDLVFSLKDEIKKHKKGVIIFTDIFGGSATNSAMSSTQELEDSIIISGINLNMLLSALTHMDKMDTKELSAKIVADGKKAILDVKEVVLGR